MLELMAWLVQTGPETASQVTKLHGCNFAELMSYEQITLHILVTTAPSCLFALRLDPRRSLLV